MSNKVIPTEIAAGIALLDEKVPHWRAFIKPNELGMEWCDRCILGQIFGDYDTGLERLGILAEDEEELENVAASLGFVKFGDWDKLTQAWKEALS